MGSLAGKVAVVTGASRGAGRGIASVLGEAGATVYVTGRSVRGSLTQPDLLGTTIEETAEIVSARGGWAARLDVAGPVWRRCFVLAMFRGMQGHSVAALAGSLCPGDFRMVRTGAELCLWHFRPEHLI